MWADLHFHSTASDGRHTVEELAKYLESADQCSIVALTDHDTMDSVSDLKAILPSHLKLISGAEMSCTVDLKSKNQEFHLLIYGIPQNDAEFHAMKERFQEERTLRFFKMCDRFESAGFHLDARNFYRDHQGSLGRPHLADLLVRKGYASSRKDAFDRWLSDQSSFVEKKWLYSVHDALQFAKDKNCRTSIAHPGAYRFSKFELSAFREMGVDAIEVFHPLHDRQQTDAYLALANDLGFAVSGGSDFHDIKSDVMPGGEARLGRFAYEAHYAEAFLGDLI